MPRRPSVRPAIFLAALLALTLALAPRAEAYVYWVGTYGNPGTPEERTAIGRANLDGSDVDHSFVTAATPGAGVGAEGIQLALTDTHIYWADPEANTIGRANLDGTGVNPRLITDAGTPAYGSGVAVDDAHIYWVSRRARDPDLAAQTGAIARANLDGTGVDENFISGLDFPHGSLAVDDSHLYWTNLDTGFPGARRIGRANLDGTGVDEDLIPWEGFCIRDVTVDDTHVWWACSAHLAGVIARANLDGTGVENVIFVDNFDLGPDESLDPCGIAVDDTHVYWANQGPAAAIGRARLDGSRVSRRLISAIGGGCGDVAVDELGPPPSNDFRLTGAKKNRKRGTAKLKVKVPGPGELKLAKNAKVKGKDTFADAAGKQKLAIKPRRKAKQKLSRKGKAKVKAKVTYTPDGGEPNTKSKKLKLKKR